MNKEVKVYHYTSLEVLKKILLSQRLRFTRMNSLNDRSEYKYGIQLLKIKILNKQIGAMPSTVTHNMNKR